MAVGVVVLLGVSLAPWVSARLNPGSAVRQPPSDAQRERLSAERIDRGDDGAYEFIAVRDDGTPVRYDPCAPIHVMVNAAAAPDGTDGLVSEALDEIADATGLVFADDGSTDVRWSDDVDRLAAETAPSVIIVWTAPSVRSDLKGDTTGTGGSVPSIDGDWYESGTVLLDAPQLDDVLDADDGRTEVLAVVMHELAHVVGLDHVDDPLELMYPESRPGVTSFGPGDLAGLAQVGAGGCRDY